MKPSAKYVSCRGRLLVKYQLLDQILYFLVDKKFDEKKVASYLEIPLKEVSRIKGMIKSSKHKLLSPSIAKVR